MTPSEHRDAVEQMVAILDSSPSISADGVARIHARLVGHSALAVEPAVPEPAASRVNPKRPLTVDDVAGQTLAVELYKGRLTVTITRDGEDFAGAVVEDPAAVQAIADHLAASAAAMRRAAAQ